MKEGKHVHEGVSLLEREMALLSESIGTLQKKIKELEDIKQEIKGIKIFLGRAHPEFKKQYPEIIKKLKS